MKQGDGSGRGPPLESQALSGSFGPTGNPPAPPSQQFPSPLQAPTKSSQQFVGGGEAACIGPTTQIRKWSHREGPGTSPSPTQHLSGRGFKSRYIELSAPGAGRGPGRCHPPFPPTPALSCPLPTKQEPRTGSDLLSFTFRAGAWLTALHRAPGQVTGQMKTREETQTSRRHGLCPGQTNPAPPGLGDLLVWRPPPLPLDTCPLSPRADPPPGGAFPPGSF